MTKLKPFTTCLWFDNQAEKAAKLYTSVFPKSSIGPISRYNKEGSDVHGRKPGSVMSVEFTINGQKFMGLNGGPIFKFSEAVSIMVHCDTQKEIDFYWKKLAADPKVGQCGWLKDKFGLSWQIVPSQMAKWMSDPKRAGAVVKAFMPMTKLDIATLKRAYESA